MFEKEAEEFVDCKNSFWRQGKTCIDSVRQAFQKGAEFGYNKAFVEADKNLKAVVADFNKANEWHYVKNGDLPKKTDEYLVYRISGYGCKSIELIQYNSSRHFWCVDCQNEVIAWKEIVLPKESE